MNDTILRVQGLKKYFPVSHGIFSRKKGDVKAVDGLDFSVKRGEIFGLVGESGCGKSTAGRTILRLMEPTAGRVQFEDTVCFDVENRMYLSDKELLKMRKDMQIVFQDPFACLDPRMNVGAIVSEGILKHGIDGIRTGKEARERAAELLMRCGLSGDCLKKYPHEFSGGQRQRIGIARALAVRPKFVVGDELIASLDVSIQAQILTLLQKIIEEDGLTMLFIAHDLSVVRYFCNRVGVMYLGAFVEVGEGEEVFSHPAHPYTRALLSAVPKKHPDDVKKRIYLKGEVPDAANPPGGCKFHTRCPYATERCRREVPEMTEISNGHAAACHYLKEGTA